MTWNHILTSSRQSDEPDTNVVRFIARNYYAVSDRTQVTFLDIGSGRHAPITTYLIRKGFTSVTAVDFAPGALAHIHHDICSLDSLAADSFDCVLDNNTLCHVENPPVEKIKTWLKPGGKFFSIAPTSETSRGHLQGKGFVRCATSEQILNLYAPFGDNIKIGLASYPTDGGQIYSWIAECQK